MDRQTESEKRKELEQKLQELVRQTSGNEVAQALSHHAFAESILMYLEDALEMVWVDDTYVWKDDEDYKSKINREIMTDYLMDMEKDKE